MNESDNKIERICRYCGKAYFSKKRGRPGKGFCCKHCADNYRYHHNDNPPKYQKTCERCSKPYETNNKEQRYCSTSCSSAARMEEYSREITCELCGAIVEVTNPRAKYCPNCSQQLERERKNAAHARRRQQTGDSHNRQVKLSEVYERAGGICEICGLPVPADVDYNDEWARTRDHIVPMSKNGEHSYSNCQLAHRICNSCKQDNGIGWGIDWMERLEEEPGKWQGKLECLDNLLEETQDSVASA